VPPDLPSNCNQPSSSSIAGQPASRDWTDPGMDSSMVRRVKALRRFTVRAQLPAALAPLQTLATHLRWTWHTPTQDLFATLDPEAWERAGHDPVRLLGEISTARFSVLAKDADTVVTVRELADDLASYLQEPRWYQLERENDPSL